ncbi:23089_t:CDS:2 [Gigaspora margarita]|uniref:23089_t:CDS:1 n=1 Tax=Gigaspora margarita TaxID=4874 RepID=A0ABM8VVQ0_GIGMA|nr:23089_t:CDS:2 [Gigaspora margarita]
MKEKFLVPEIWSEIFQYLASVNFSYLHNFLLFNCLFCRLVVPLLWADPFGRARSDDSRIKIINIYLSNLNNEKKNDLDKLLKSTKTCDKYSKPKTPLFPYVNFLRRYSCSGIKSAGSMWCMINDIFSLRVEPTISSLDFSFSLHPYGINESIIRLIRETSPKLKKIRVIKANFASGITEEGKRAMQELISAQYTLEEFQLNYSSMITEENLSKVFIMPPKEFKNLCILSLNAILFTENDLRNLASLPNLIFLKVEDSCFEIEGKEMIANYSLTKLQELELKQNELVINKFLVSMKCETLKTISITLTMLQIDNKKINKDFFDLICCNFPNLVSSNFFISKYPADLLLNSEGERIYYVKDEQRVFIF